jgi:hypothetical protein
MVSAFAADLGGGHVRGQIGYRRFNPVHVAL